MLLFILFEREEIKESSITWRLTDGWKTRSKVVHRWQFSHLLMFEWWTLCSCPDGFMCERDWPNACFFFAQFKLDNMFSQFSFKHFTETLWEFGIHINKHVLLWYLVIPTMEPSSRLKEVSLCRVPAALLCHVTWLHPTNGEKRKRQRPVETCSPPWLP